MRQQVLHVSLAAALVGLSGPALAQQQQQQPQQQPPPQQAQPPQQQEAQQQGQQQPVPRTESQIVASAEMRDAQGRSLGTVAFLETPHGVLVQPRLQGLEQGVHGFHIHENGVCEPPEFQSAGGHYNPGGQAHGYFSPDGPHAGDLPNVVAGSDGSAEADMLMPDLSLQPGDEDSLLRQGGTTVVLHQGPDDYQTDPAGASGPRIACGVIQPNVVR